MRPLVLLVAVFALAASVHAQTDAIRLNQVGFYPDAPKLAVVVDAAAGPFTVVRPSDGATVYEGTLGPAQTWSASGETVRQADFSALTEPGAYEVVVPGVGTSYSFRVGDYVHQGVARGALKAYYFMRVSTPIRTEYAGAWARPAGHPDTQVRVHPSAATATRPAGTVISAPGGWYDAGDFNKYVVNSGISVQTLLLLLEQYPDYVAALETGIPESGDGVPDLLDEVLYNVRWMLAMQDEDGGVYHKLTTANFAGKVMPHQAMATRYVVQKGTAATLDFAAVMAQASRIVAGYEDDLPGLADSLRSAALDAWGWARANPNVRYAQSALNAAFDPDINTGEYGDGTFDDEFDWAAMELYLTTEADSFLTATQPFSPINVGTPWWGGVRELGYYSVLAHRDEVGAEVPVQALQDALVNQADFFLSLQAGSPYEVVMGGQSWMWGWGSNSAAANQGVTLMVAHQLTGDRRYLEAALANLDYLLGRNATGYSFVTGFGDKTPMDIHHRPSAADGVADPVPGLLVGGPNPGQQDVNAGGCSASDYPAGSRDDPARSYVDDWCSYASNEITINWNAPLVYLAAAVEAALSETGQPTAGEGAPGIGGLDVEAAPNPFRAATAVRFQLAAPGAVTVRVFDTLGREVRRPLAAAPLGSGSHAIGIDGEGLPAGVYVVSVEASHASASRAVTLIR